MQTETKTEAKDASNGGERKLLKDQVYEKLKARILSEVYPPGSFLSERLLAEDLGYGKSPVRQAAQRL